MPFRCWSISIASESPNAWAIQDKSSKNLYPSGMLKNTGMSLALLESLLRKLQRQPQWIGEAVSKISQPGQQVNVEDLRLRKFREQWGKIIVRNSLRRARQLFHVRQSHSFLVVVPGIISRLE